MITTLALFVVVPTLIIGGKKLGNSADIRWHRRAYAAEQSGNPAPRYPSCTIVLALVMLYGGLLGSLYLIWRVV